MNPARQHIVKAMVFNAVKDTSNHRNTKVISATRMKLYTKDSNLLTQPVLEHQHINGSKYGETATPTVIPDISHTQVLATSLQHLLQVPLLFMPPNFDCYYQFDSSNDFILLKSNIL